MEEKLDFIIGGLWKVLIILILAFLCILMADGAWTLIHFFGVHKQT